MPRTLRLAAEGGIHHLINRGDYRRAVYAEETTKAGFLRCPGETGERTGWHEHAWCIRSSHYHLAVEMPRANLVDGMRCLRARLPSGSTSCATGVVITFDQEPSVHPDFVPLPIKKRILTF